MRLLEERIRAEGKIFPGEVLKVSSFLNHQIDDELLEAIGKEISGLYSGLGITKILTVEASGIAIACAAARYLHARMLFAKKSVTSNISKDCYSAEIHSYTHNKDHNILVEKQFLKPTDIVLIADDFLAKGQAIRGLIDIVKQAGAVLVGCAVAIEKGFQGGGDSLRAEGIRVESLAIIDSMENGELLFRKQNEPGII